jgi:hypothetical protein
VGDVKVSMGKNRTIKYKMKKERNNASGNVGASCCFVVMKLLDSSAGSTTRTGVWGFV